MFLGGELGTSSILDNHGVGHRLLPECAHQIVMDGIEWHPLDTEIEENHVCDRFRIEPEPHTEMSFPRKMPSSERTGINFEVFISVNIHNRPCLEETKRVKILFNHRGLCRTCPGTPSLFSIHENVIQRGDRGKRQRSSMSPSGRTGELWPDYNMANLNQKIFEIITKSLIRLPLRTKS
jgi:hypothetical protein